MLYIHDCRQVEVACPQAFRSLLHMKHSPVRGACSQPCRRQQSCKAVQLQGSGNLVPGLSLTVGEVLQEENQSHNQR